MSTAAIKAVFTGTQHSGFELAMMLAIANHAEHHGCAWAYLHTLADACRITTEQASGVIATLVQSGELDVTKTPPFEGFNMGEMHCYRITIIDGPVRARRQGGAA